MMAAMKSTAPDPYRKTRAYWRRMRALAWWVVFQHRALSTAGLLDRSGAARRWLMRWMSALEHGMRCLLIIGAQGAKVSSPAHPPNTVIPDGRKSIWGSIHGRCKLRIRELDSQTLCVGNDGVEEITHDRRRRFSLTLKAFNQPPNSRNTEDAGTNKPKSHTHPGESRALARRTLHVDEDFGASRKERDLLDARLEAVFEIFANSEIWTARMARRIARAGIRLKKRPASRPVNRAPVPLKTQTTAGRIIAPAVVDSS